VLDCLPELSFREGKGALRQDQAVGVPDLPERRRSEDLDERDAEGDHETLAYAHSHQAYREICIGNGDRKGLGTIHGEPESQIVLDFFMGQPNIFRSLRPSLSRTVAEARSISVFFLKISTEIIEAERDCCSSGIPVDKTGTNSRVKNSLGRAQRSAAAAAAARQHPRWHTA
jgi:hypothetical protein